MASFAYDQAEGLRRMAAGVKPRVFTFLSAASPDDKQGMLVNLAASLTRVGSDVMVVDACRSGRSITHRMGIHAEATLAEVASGERALAQALHATQPGFQYAVLGGSSAKADGASLNAVFAELQRHADVVLTDAELDESGTLPVAAMADSEIVVQVTPHAEAIKQAYLLVKQLHGQLGRRSFSMLVTGASEKDAQRIFANLAQTASRYLAVELRIIGVVPADEHLNRAVTLERPVVEAFPLAAASVAFRQIASWFAQQGGMYARRESWSGQEAELVLAGA